MKLSTDAMGCILFQTHLIAVRPGLSAYSLRHSAFFLDIMSAMFGFRTNLGASENGHVKKMRVFPLTPIWLRKNVVIINVV